MPITSFLRKFSVVLAYFFGLAIPVITFVGMAAWESEIEGFYRYIEPQPAESADLANSYDLQSTSSLAEWEAKLRHFKELTLLVVAPLCTLLYFSFWWSWNSKGTKVINHYFLRIILPWVVTLYPLWFAFKWWMRMQG